MKSKKLIFGILALVVMGAVLWFKGCGAVDRCLDVGGHWNHQTKACEH
jgi:hypothetical protein